MVILCECTLSIFVTLLQWYDYCLRAKLAKGMGVLLSVLIIVHYSIPTLFTKHLRSLSFDFITCCLCILKGLLVMRGNNDCSYSTLCAISSLIVMFSGAARWITNRYKKNAISGEENEDESEVRMELRRLINNTASSIEHYL